MRDTIKRTTNTTNNIFAIPANAEAIPKKPNMPATIAKMKNNNAHPNIGIILPLKSVFVNLSCY
jgi:hypothetical protein